MTIESTEPVAPEGDAEAPTDASPPPAADESSNPATLGQLLELSATIRAQFDALAKRVTRLESAHDVHAEALQLHRGMLNQQGAEHQSRRTEHTTHTQAVSRLKDDIEEVRKIALSNRPKGP